MKEAALFAVEQMSPALQTDGRVGLGMAIWEFPKIGDPNIVP